MSRGVHLINKAPERYEDGFELAVNADRDVRTYEVPNSRSNMDAMEYSSPSIDSEDGLYQVDPESAQAEVEAKSSIEFVVNTDWGLQRALLACMQHRN
jgi:hypothetical protein